MRTKISISLPFELELYARTRVRDGGYSSMSEYLRELIRIDQRVHILNPQRELVERQPTRSEHPPYRGYR